MLKKYIPPKILVHLIKLGNILTLSFNGNAEQTIPTLDKPELLDEDDWDDI